MSIETTVKCHGSNGNRRYQREKHVMMCVASENILYPKHYNDATSRNNCSHSSCDVSASTEYRRLVSWIRLRRDGSGAVLLAVVPWRDCMFLEITTMLLLPDISQMGVVCCGLARAFLEILISAY